MTKIVQASVVSGIVKIDGIDASDVQIIADGQADSSGYALIGHEFAVYIVNTQPDLKNIIEKLISLTEQLSLLAQTPVSKTPDQTPLNPAVQVEIDLLKSELESIELK